MSALSALLLRDMRLAVRVGGGAMMGVLFFLIVVTLVPFAMYSGVSDGASGARPWEPSESGADAVGRGGGPPRRAPAGGAPAVCG